MHPKAEDCDDCTPAYARRSFQSNSLPSIVFASLPFALTFLIVSALVLQKLFPLLSAPKASHDKSNHARSPLSSRTGSPPSPLAQRPTVKRVAAITFSVTIALSAVLTEILLCEISNSFNPTARRVALQVTVTCLLFLLIVAIPLLELYSVISSAGWKFTGSEKGRLRLAWVFEIVGFGIYVLGFWLVGRRLPSNSKTSESKARQNLTEACLERIGFVGISLMALLSGFASVSSLWQSFGVKPKRVSEADIQRKKAGLDATSDMLLAKRSRLRALERKTLDAPSESFFKKAIGSIRGNADTQEMKALELEISGLEMMSMSLQTSLAMLQSRKASQQRAVTPFGRVLVFVSYIFSLYCLYRICTALLSALRRWWSPQSILAGSDPVTNFLALLAKHYDPSLDSTAWSRQISFLLSGFILLASFSAVLQTFHFFARFTPSVLYTAQANLALLVSQVCGMYVISSALLLRSMTPKEVGSVINDALGTGVLEAAWVDRWFEGWFLFSVALTMVGIWLGRKIGGAGEWEDDVWDEDVEIGKRS